MKQTGHPRSYFPLSDLASRRTASHCGFFDLSQVFDGPLRYGESSRFETMPSRPNRQACSNTAGHVGKCSHGAMLARRPFWGRHLY
jgi:hypothetical protein